MSALPSAKEGYKRCKVPGDLHAHSYTSISLVVEDNLTTMATAPPFNPIIANGGFELGTLFPWIPSDANAATILNGTGAYAGDYYLGLQTAPGNRANTVHQPLHDLNTDSTYAISAKVWGPAVSTANYCSAYIYTGENATTGLIASVMIEYDISERWLDLRGDFTPKAKEELLYVSAGCTLSGASHTGRLLFDEIKIEIEGVEEAVLEG
ncbi:hypothetical protein BJY04DRAFT_199322 [Aspergillus karnatakaensis]|uniref:uncharacterized protein n=1 Tax=Aspergillus karnatakaensis TaxID=1810916 RepID=UPI003CCDBDF2